MIDASRIPVLIVGAGPAGATMAIELQRYGVPHRLIDKAPGPTEQSRALGIQTRTLEMFHRMRGAAGNVGETVAAAARPMQGFVAYGDDGHPIATLAMSLDQSVSRYPHEMVLPQSRTQRVLLDHLDAEGGRAEFDTELVEMTAEPDGARALLRRADGTEEWVEADWIVGADGASSLTRRLIGDNFIGAEYEEKFLLADVTLHWPLADTHGHIFLRAEGPIVAFPYPDHGRWRLIDTSNTAQTGEKAATLDRFKHLFGALVPDMTIEDAGWTSLFRVHRRLVERYRVGRVLLMGDAAHIHSPASGQGLNTGVQDAVNLAWKLALVVHGRAGDTLLDSYEPERRPVAEGVLRDSHRITEAMLTRNPVVEHVRDWMLRFALGFEGVQHRLATGISNIETNYRSSPIISDARRARSVRAGDRMPDPSLSGGLRLSDSVSRAGGLRQVLLLLGETAELGPALAQSVASRGLDDLIVTRIADAADAAILAQAFDCRLEDAAAYIIRPDLYLGFCGAAHPSAVDDIVRDVGAALDQVFGTTGAHQASHAPGGPARPSRAMSDSR